MTTLDGRNLFAGTTLAALLAVYLIWGSTYLAIRIAIETLPTFSMAGLRYLVAGAALYAWGRSRGARGPERRHLLPALAIGGLLLLGGNGLVVWAEHRVPSGIAALLVAVEPLWIALLMPLFGAGKRPSARTFVGIAVGLLGVFVLVGGRELGASAVDLTGALAVVVAAASWASGSLYSVRAATPESPWISSGLQMLFGGLLLGVTGLGAGEWSRFDPSAVSLRSLLALGYLVVFGSIVAFTAYSYLLRNARPTVVSTYAFVNPVVAVLLGWFFVAEPLTWRVGVAALFILGALVAIMHEEPEVEQQVVNPDPETIEAPRSCVG
ncbi:MAG: EamA family transporter [Thermoanaerobaculia bacterium]